jgi:ribose transport system substrate-binding protein
VRSRAALVSLALVLLGACQQNKRKVIAVVPKATSHLFWVAVERGAREAGEQFQVEIDYNGASSETDYSRQIQIVDSMVARRVDGMAVAATESKALMGPVERAMKAGIPVTVFDSGIDGENYLSFVATNNYEGGQLAARELARLVGVKGNVGLLMTAPGSNSTMDRERGFEDVLAKEFPGLKIVARQYGMSDRAKSRSAAENMLTAHGDLLGIFASAEPASVGTALAIQARGLAGKVKLVAFDSSEGMVEDLKNGVIQAMVVQDPRKMGFEAVRTVVEKLAGKSVPKRIDLSAQVIRVEDLGKPEVQALLTPEKATGK